ncbi:MAG: SDR family oxidoreductase [Clostridiales bacterium]|nr:SDR family oxidoreductase [Clostridiales bacterium]
MVDVKGRWALVTGSSRGLGRLAARFLAERGCNIILHGRKLSNLDDAVKEIRDLGVNVLAVEAELTDMDEISKMLKTIDSSGVDVDIVLNNAGYQIAYRTDYYNTPAEDYRVSFLVNTTAPMMICYHFLPKMEARGFGRIVNTTSGIDKEPEQAGYSAAKAALDKVTRDLGSRLEGSDVMINLADPGWCRTDLGGPNAPNSPDSAIPGVVLGAFMDDKHSGRIFRAQEYKGMTIEEAVKAAEENYG